MTNSPSMTPGHRVMTLEQIALIEKVRALGIAIEGVLNEVADRHRTQRTASEEFGEAADDLADHITVAQPERWLAMARTDLQCGLMKLTRAVAQPEFF